MMFKILAPLCAAVALSWAGSASAGVTQIYTGTIDNDEYDGTTQQFYGQFGSYGGGSGRFRVDYWGPVAPLAVEVVIRYQGDVSYYDINGNYTGGYDFNQDIYTPVTITAKGFTFEVETMANTRYTSPYPDSYGAYNIPYVTEVYSYSWFNMMTDVYYSDMTKLDPVTFDQVTNPAAAGKPYELRVTALPEPTTWAMMIVGFGLVGGALRQRGRALVTH